MGLSDESDPCPCPEPLVECLEAFGGIMCDSFPSKYLKPDIICLRISAGNALYAFVSLRTRCSFSCKLSTPKGAHIWFSISSILTLSSSAHSELILPYIPPFKPNGSVGALGRFAPEAGWACGLSSSNANTC